MGVEPIIYRTIVDADDYFSNQLFAGDWTGASTTDKTKSLVMSTNTIDSILFAGEKASLFEARAASPDTVLTAVEVTAANALQTRQWPRDGAADPESWTLTIDATGGTYTLSFNGQTTGAIAFDATAATIQTALVALSDVTVGDILVTVNPAGTDAAGPYDVTVAGDLKKVRYNTLTSNAASLTGGAQTAQVIVLNDNIPDSIFWGEVEEAITLLTGRIIDQEFRNLVLTSDGAGSTRVSQDRSSKPPEHTTHFFTSPSAWKYIRQFVANNNTFDIFRTS